VRGRGQDDADGHREQHDEPEQEEDRQERPAALRLVPPMDESVLADLAPGGFPDAPRLDRGSGRWIDDVGGKGHGRRVTRASVVRKPIPRSRDRS
jgi:hypothetical protein